MKIIKAGQDEVVARLPRGAKINAEPRQAAPQQIDRKIMQGWEPGEGEGSLPPRPGDVFEGLCACPDALGAASRLQGCRRCSPPTCGRGSWRPPSATSPAARPGSWCAAGATAAASASPPSPAATAPRPTSRRWRAAWPSSSEPGRATTASLRSQVRLGRPHQASPSLPPLLWEQPRLGGGAPGQDPEWLSHREDLRARVEGYCLQPYLHCLLSWVC